MTTCQTSIPYVQEDTNRTFLAQNAASRSKEQNLNFIECSTVFSTNIHELSGHECSSDELSFWPFGIKAEASIASESKAAPRLQSLSSEYGLNYCSTCKKERQVSAFSLKTPKTCSACLSKKKNRRRGGLTLLGTLETACCQSRTEKQRICSSCKCTRALMDFTCWKTCTKCKSRKRKPHEKLERFKYSRRAKLTPFYTLCQGL